MIRHLTIERFKSVRSLSLACRKVNVFIGAPDTGKTNILEALYLLSRLGWGLPLDSSLRVRQELGFDALFYRQFFDQPFRIAMTVDQPPERADRGSGELALQAAISGTDRALDIEVASWSVRRRFSWGGVDQIPFLDWIRYYTYTYSSTWSYDTSRHHGTTLVTVPDGHNLIYVARHNQKVYDFLKEIVSALNWKLRFDQGQKTFRLSEVRREEIIDYNIDLLSDSLKRLFFYGAILLSTSDQATLVMDEPDVFAFPPYPKTLGEMIAGDASNQFFLTTHNPYFLAALAEKTPTDDLALFVCHRDPEGGTLATALTADQVSRVIELGSSVFFNLDEFTGS